MKTRQQADALMALKQVQDIKDSGDQELKTTYARAVHRFAMLIRQNGLQQTLGFYAGKGAVNKAEQKFLRHVAAALELGTEDPTETVLSASLEEYMRLSRRCLEVAVWHRRFVESVLKIDVTGSATADVAGSASE